MELAEGGGRRVESDEIVLPEIPVEDLRRFVSVFDRRSIDVERARVMSAYLPFLSPPDHLVPAIEESSNATRKQVEEADALGEATVALRFERTAEFAELIEWSYSRMRLGGTLQIPDAFPEEIRKAVSTHRQLVEGAVRALGWPVA
jgi:hypothetical protein